MTTADEFQPINESVFYWSVYEPACKCELASTAIRTSNGGLVVVDPIPLAEPAWRELLAIAPLRAILLTNGNHERNAARLRAEHHVPVVTAPLTHHDLTGLKPDITLLEGELLYGIAPVFIPGATPGETAFYHADSGTMVIGDAAIHLDLEKGIQFLPAKYCTDAEQNRASLGKVLNFRLRTLTFAHGLPVTEHAEEKWRELLSS